MILIRLTLTVFFIEERRVVREGFKSVPGYILVSCRKLQSFDFSGLKNETEKADFRIYLRVSIMKLYS